MRVEKLRQTEEGVLLGGFTKIEKADDTDALVNGNCSGSGILYNDNCGCNKCGLSSEDPDPNKGKIE